MRCSNCGNSLKKDDEFCNVCGTPVNKNKKESKNTHSRGNSLHPKRGLFVCMIILLVILFTLGGYLIVQLIGEADTPIKEVWGDTYYVYLKEILNENKQEDAHLPKSITKGKLGFFHIKELLDPIMILSYQNENETYSNIYYIEDGKVNSLFFEAPTTVALYYQMEDQIYDYYTRTSSTKEESYTKVSDQVLKKANSKTYTFGVNDKEHAVDVTGKEISLSKVDEVFVQPTMVDHTVDFNYELDEQTLKNKVKECIETYQTVDELVNDEVKNEVAASVDKVTKTKEEIEKIVESKYTSGIKDIESALTYEIGFYFDDQKIIRSNDSFAGIFDVTTTSLKANDIKDSDLLKRVYHYLEKIAKLDYEGTYSEDEIKGYIQDLYGSNYTYDHKLYQTASCYALTYDDELEKYAITGGGCGGVTPDFEPYYLTMILSTSDTSVTIGTIYVVPTKDESDGFSAMAPYNIYTDSSKTKRLATLDSLDDASIHTLLSEKGTQHEITFDVDNGYYHFNHLEKVEKD